MQIRGVQVSILKLSVSSSALVHTEILSLP